MIIVGLQEFTVQGYDTKKVLIPTWNSIIQSNIGKLEAEYTMLQDKNVGGLYIVLYAKSNLVPFFSGMKSSKVDISKTQESNIGAAILSFKFIETPLTLINCRLSNKKEDYRKRFEEMKTIYSGMKDDNSDAIKFIFGDLNFRLEQDKITSSFMVQQEKFAEMLKYDQLWGKFHQFNYLPRLEEMKISFPPTYKFIKGTSKYDLENRAPAWCDRILWLSNKHVVCEKYDSIPSLTFSMHKPIYGIYRITLQPNSPYKRDEEEVKGKEEELDVKHEVEEGENGQGEDKLKMKSMSNVIISNKVEDTPFSNLVHSGSASELSLKDFMISDFYKVSKKKPDQRKSEEDINNSIHFVND